MGSRRPAMTGYEATSLWKAGIWNERALSFPFSLKIFLNWKIVVWEDVRILGRGTLGRSVDVTWFSASFVWMEGERERGTAI